MCVSAGVGTCGGGGWRVVEEVVGCRVEGGKRVEGGSMLEGGGRSLDGGTCNG